MEIVFGWLILSILGGAIASSKGRSGIGFFFLSVFLTPLVGILAAAFMPSLKPAAGVDTRERVPCFKCAELVLPEAVVCKHCGADLAALRAEAQQQAQAAYDARMAPQREKAALRAQKAQAVGRSLGGFFTGKK
jgi:hypothetical protein